MRTLTFGTGRLTMLLLHPIVARALPSPGHEASEPDLHHGSSTWLSVHDQPGWNQQRRKRNKKNSNKTSDPCAWNSTDAPKEGEAAILGPRTHPSLYGRRNENVARRQRERRGRPGRSKARKGPSPKLVHPNKFLAVTEEIEAFKNRVDSIVDALPESVKQVSN